MIRAATVIKVPEPAEPSTPVPLGAVYSRDDSQRAWARRRADLEDVAGLEEVLANIDARARELENVRLPSSPA